MLIKLLVVGRMRDPHWQAKAAEFAKWLTPYAKVEVVELKDSGKEREGVALLQQLREERDYLIVLSEDGAEVTSVALAAKLAAIDRKIVFVIGGPEGLSAEVKARADWLWALSKLTFTHEMARVLLLEQIYRAINIAKGGQYHKF